MRKNSITIAVLIDGLGWQLAREHNFLQFELPHRGPLATVFGSGSACHPTILTGAFPSRHGHFAPFTYDPANSPFGGLGWLRRLPAQVAKLGRVRRWLSGRAQRQLGFSGDFQLHNTPFHLLEQMDYTEKHDLFQPRGIQSGVQSGMTTLFDDLQAAKIPFHLSVPQASETTNLAAAARHIATGDPRFACVLLPGLEALLHARGNGSAAVGRKLRWYEDQLRDLLHIAKVHYDEVRLAVFSGYGMTDVTGECDAMTRIEALPLQFGTDYFAIYDATMARFWFLNADAESRIGAALSGSHDGQWLSDDTLRQWGCDFPDARYGQRIFLLRPGVLMNPSFAGRSLLAAMHGYDPWHKDSVAFFASNDPGMGCPACLSDLRHLLATSVGVYRLAGSSAKTSAVTSRPSPGLPGAAGRSAKSQLYRSCSVANDCKTLTA
jgi:hypothetical protein